MRIVWTAAAAVVTLLAALCPQSAIADVAGGLCGAGAGIVPAMQVGPVALGAAPADAVAALGRPGDVTAWPESPSMRDAVRNTARRLSSMSGASGWVAAQWHGAGLLFHDGVLVMIVLQAVPDGVADTCMTLERVGFGSSSADLMKTYGAPEHTAPTSGGGRAYLYERGVVFDVRSGVVYRIAIFRPADVCSVFTTPPAANTPPLACP